MKVRWLVSGAPLLGLLLCAAEARAGKFAETLDLSLGVRGSLAAVDAPLQALAGIDAADALEDAGPRVRGEQLWSGILRGGFTIEGLRFGIGVGLTGAPGYTMSLQSPLPAGFGFRDGSLWGGVYEGYLGYAFGAPNELRPYLELRGGVTVLQAVVALDHAELGGLGDSRLNAYLPSLVMRAGLRLPLGEFFFLDAGAGASPIGAEVASGTLSLGLPVPLANL